MASPKITHFQKHEPVIAVEKLNWILAHIKKIVYFFTKSTKQLDLFILIFWKFFKGNNFESETINTTMPNRNLCFCVSRLFFVLLSSL
jgi:hypothetical protein